VQANFEWIKANSTHASVMLLLYYSSTVHTRYRELHTEIRDLGANRVEAILRLLPKTEGLSNAKREAVARNIQGLITGNLIEACAKHHRKDLKKILKRTQQEVQNLANGG